MLRVGPHVLDQGFISCVPGAIACSYLGDFVRFRLIDVRMYPSLIAEKHVASEPDRPYRVYVEDYDDSNWEKRYATLDEAREAIEQLSVLAPLTTSKIRAVGLETA
jgi:hypothetical protein